MKRGAPLNPFSACFHQPGALPYRFREGESAEALWQRFLSAGRRGAIAGPHGTGKTTLLRTLEPVARSTGEVIRNVTLHDGQRWTKELFQNTRGQAAGAVQGPQASCPPGSLEGVDRQTLFLDGAEQLAPVAWFALRLWTRAAGIGLLVTTHRPLGLPALYTTSVDAEAALWVTQRVLAKNPRIPCLVEAESVKDALAKNKGNLREALFCLYDVYEDRWNVHAGNGTVCSRL